METVIHISPISNRESILKNGIVPSEIKLDHHLMGFRSAGLLNDSESKVVYCWEDCNKNDKYIRDLIYCKYWLHPRNNFFGIHYEKFNDYFNFKGFENINYWCNTDKMIFDVYEIEYDTKVDKNYYCYHGQEPNDSVTGTTFGMDDKYAHDDKPLVVFKNKLMNLKLIKQAVWENNKNGYSVKICKSVNY